MRISASAAFLLNAALTGIFRGIIFIGLELYYLREIHMNPLQLVLVGTALELACFLFELPTGIVADVYSRRLSVLIGSFTVGVAYIITGAAPLFIVIILAEFMRGIGETFISGAEEAWITDEVGEGTIGPLFARAMRYSMFYSMLGAGVCVLLTTWLGGGLTVLIGGVGLIATTALMAIIMPETAFTAKVHHQKDHSLMAGVRVSANTFREGIRAVRGSSVLTLLVVIAFIIGAASEGFDRLWKPHLNTSFVLPQISLPAMGALDDVVWIFILDVVLTLAGMTVLKALETRIQKIDTDRLSSRVLVLLNGARMFATLIFALSGNVWLAMAAYVVVDATRNLSHPINQNWRNKNIPSEVRATVISMHSQADAFGQIVAGPGVGYVGRLFGFRAAIALAAVLFLPALALYVRRRTGQDTSTASVR